MSERRDEEPSGLRRVLSIVDDDGPDSVYLDGDLDPGGAKHRVVIVDDGGDGQPRATRSAAENRLRSRRIAVNRQAGRERWGVNPNQEQVLERPSVDHIQHSAVPIEHSEEVVRTRI